LRHLVEPGESAQACERVAENALERAEKATEEQLGEPSKKFGPGCRGRLLSQP
jgi:hypothetical protein